MDQPRTIFISNESKKAPVHRGFLGVGIVPTGELEGRQDRSVLLDRPAGIVPTGELEGRQDYASHRVNAS